MHRRISIAAATIVFSTLMAYQDVPPGHPPVLPTGHPPVEPGEPSAAPGERPAADPADVESVDAVVKAYYASISGPEGKERQWDRFRSLFAPNARMMTMRTMGTEKVPMVLTPEDFMASNSTYFEGGGYFEQELHRELDQFGSIAQVFSTYASRRNLNEAEPYSRGINSFQLMNDGTRWWIVTVAWDRERSLVNPIPKQYLPADSE